MEQISSQEKRPILKKSDYIIVGIITVVLLILSIIYNNHYMQKAICTVEEPDGMWETMNYTINITKVTDLKTEYNTQIFERTKNGFKFTDEYRLELETHPNTRRVYITCEMP